MGTGTHEYDGRSSDGTRSSRVECHHAMDVKLGPGLEAQIAQHVTGHGVVCLVGQEQDLFGLECVAGNADKGCDGAAGWIGSAIFVTLLDGREVGANVDPKILWEIVDLTTNTTTGTFSDIGVVVC